MSGDYSSFDRIVSIPTSQVTTQGDEIILPGNISHHLTLPDSADWNFAGEFCIELFGAKFASVSVLHGLISHYNASGNQRAWALDFDGTASPNKLLRFRASTDGTSTGGAFLSFTGILNAAANTAYDLCVERDSADDVRIYADGSMLAKQNFAGTLFNSTELVDIGMGSAQTQDPWNGRFKAIRITRVARYASDGGYVVPSLPLPSHA